MTTTRKERQSRKDKPHPAQHSQASTARELCVDAVVAGSRSCREQLREYRLLPERSGYNAVVTNQAPRKRHNPKFAFLDRLLGATVTERMRIEREGVPAEFVNVLITETGLNSGALQRLARIPKATYTKKMREDAAFTGTAGQSMIGFVDLINRVEEMLAAEKDNPEAKNFDAKKWVGEWIQQAQPALGGLAPIDIMDTPTGRESVMRLLGAMQSGAYQ